MESSSISDYMEKVTEPLVKSLSTPLPDENNPQAIKELKRLVGYAESQRARLAVIKRRLDALVEERRNELVEEYNKMHADDARRVTKDVRDVYVKAMLSREISSQKYVEELQDTLRGRVSLGQSFLKASNVEDNTISSSNLMIN